MNNDHPSNHSRPNDSPANNDSSTKNATENPAESAHKDPGETARGSRVEIAEEQESKAGKENPLALSDESTSAEVVAALKECAARLGHVPTLGAFRRLTGLRKRRITKLFGSYTMAIELAGLEAQGPGTAVSAAALFSEWARVTQKLGSIPTMEEFEKEGKYSRRPFRRRFGTWRRVPEAMLEYALETGRDADWPEVMDVLRRHVDVQREKRGTFSEEQKLAGTARVFYDRQLLGKALINVAMAFAPRNEAGVMVLFGAMAMKLGFIILWVGSEFPDCLAVREVQPGVWQLVRIEFEFQSRNFSMHRHEKTGCDLIVCWEHNWPECELEVLELKKVAERQ